jgi:NADH dehydrogenase/NADH:ubiquinone oxidoreductase subunit G
MDDLRIPSIKRNEKLTIEVNGREIEAYKGETVLAALLAAGFKQMKKNPVNYAPRGALCGMGVCFECAVTIDGVPNIRACMTEVQEGMKISTND